MSTSLFDVFDVANGTAPPEQFSTRGSGNDLMNTTKFPQDLNASSSITTEVSKYNDPLAETKEILFNIQYVLLPIFLVTGILGNSLTIVTMASRHFNHMTSRYILIFMAISDTVLLFTQPFNKLWIIQLFGRDLRALSDTACKAFFVIFKSSKMTSSWLVVLLCFERFIAVAFPLKVKTILRKRIIFPAIAFDYVFMLVYNSIWSFSSQVVGGICKPDVPSLKHQMFVIFGASFYSFIPTTLLLIFTPQIIFRLRKQMRIRRTLSTHSAYDSKRDEELIRASFMVLGVMIAYIILIVPITLCHLIAYAKGVSVFDETSYGFFVFREIAQMLEQINYAVNFFFYVMCSTIFRRRVTDILCLRGLRSRQQRPTNSSSSSRRAISHISKSVSNSTTMETVSAANSAP